MELMQCMAKEPLHLTYRAVGSSTGQKEFVGPDDKALGVPRRPVTRESVCDVNPCVLA